MFGRLLVAVMLVIAALAPAGAQAAKKMALVIGNNAYEGGAISILDRAVADARAYSKVLSEERGFEVTTLLDVGKAETITALGTFASKVEPGDIVMFVYSGHAKQLDPNRRDQLFLLPTDLSNGNYKSGMGLELFLELHAISFATITRTLEASGAKMRIYLLDACRDAPQVGDSNTRNAGLGTGIGRITHNKGEFIFYSAGPGEEALDRLRTDPPDPDGTSVFTRVFLEEFRAGVALEAVAQEVQVRVSELAATENHVQNPYISEGVKGWACLEKECGTDAAPPPPPPPADDGIEASFWDACSNSDNPAYCQAYLDQFPDGPRAALARLRIQELVRVEEEARLAATRTTGGGATAGAAGVAREEPPADEAEAPRVAAVDPGKSRSLAERQAAEEEREYRIAGLRADLDLLRAEHEGVSREYGAMKERIAELSQQYDTAIARKRPRSELNAVAAELAVAKVSIEEVATRTSELKARIGEKEAEIAALRLAPPAIPVGTVREAWARGLSRSVQIEGRSFAMSADGKLIATGGSRRNANPGLALRDPATGEVLAQSRQYRGFGYPVAPVFIYRDARILARSGNLGMHFYLHDASTAEVIAELKAPEGAEVALDDARERVAVVTPDGALTVYDAEDLAVRRRVTLALETGRKERVTRAAFEPGRGRIAIGTSTGRLLLVHADIGRVEMELNDRHPVDKILFSRDGSVMVVNHYDVNLNAGGLVAYRTEGGRFAETRLDLCKKICFPILSPRGGYVSDQGRLVDTRTGRLDMDLGKSTWAAFSGDDRQVIFVSQDFERNADVVALYDLSTRKRVFRQIVEGGTSTHFEMGDGYSLATMALALFTADGTGIVLRQRIDYSDMRTRLVFLDAATGDLVETMDFADGVRVFPIDDFRHFAAIEGQDNLQIFETRGR